MPTPALQKYLEEQFGGSFEVSTKVVSVGTSPTKLCENNFERMGLLFVLLGGTPAYWSPKSDVTTTSGAQMTAAGYSVSFTARDDLSLVGYDFYAVTASGTTDVYVLEIKRYEAA